MKASPSLQIIILGVLSLVCILVLTYLYSMGTTPPDLLVGFSGAIIYGLISETSQDNALSRADRVVKNSVIEVSDTPTQ